MGVFIGWSGKNTKSYLVADALRRWLEKVIQQSKPWISEHDIDAGQRWATELFDQLNNHHVGIICVTNENKDQPWINFEAGVLAKQFTADKPAETRVCPLLIEVTENDVTGPLKLLQMVRLTRDGMFKVLEMVNKHALEEPLKESVLRDSFEKRWPDLEAELERMKVPEQPEKSGRGVEEMLQEILSLVRSIDKATSPAPDLASSMSWDTLAAMSGKVQRGSGSLARNTFAQSLKVKLLAEVEKSIPVALEILERGSPEFVDKTLILNFTSYLAPIFDINVLTNPPYFDALKKAVSTLGYRVKLVQGVTSIDL